MVDTLAVLGSAGAGRELSGVSHGMAWPDCCPWYACLRGATGTRSSGLDTAPAVEDARACRGKSRPGKCLNSQEAHAEPPQQKNPHATELSVAE